jgi:hypothetical protein
MFLLWGSHLVERGRVLRHTFGVASHFAVPSIDRSVRAMGLGTGIASRRPPWGGRAQPTRSDADSRCRAKGCRSNSELSLEPSGEMALIRESGSGSNFRKRLVPLTQTFGGPLQA